MVSNEAAGTLVPSMSALDDPAFGLDDEAGRNGFWPQLLLAVAPSVAADLKLVRT